MTGVIRRRMVVHGRVQGVGFRLACIRAADRLGVRGWVRNRPEGTVEAVAEGEPDAVECFVEWLRTGPPQARVDQVEVTDEPVEGLDAFRRAD